jgi:hypothetical protein
MRWSVWGAAARAIAPRIRTAQVTDWLSQVQAWRGDLEELEAAALHFMALPSRGDLRKLQRRVVGLRRRVSELDRAVARLERALDEKP